MSEDKENDVVNHPKHYNNHPSGVECITITEHMTFNLGNAIKYIWRAEHKNGVEDLKKAIFYLNREIERIAKLGIKTPQFLGTYKESEAQEICYYVSNNEKLKP